MVEPPPERASGFVSQPPSPEIEVDVERAIGALMVRGVAGPDEARRQMEQVAAAEGRSVVEVARDLLERALRSQDRSPARLAVMYAELGGALAGTPGPDRLRLVTELAVERLPGAVAASVTVLRRTRFETLQATDEQARTADQLQYELGEGPCVAAARGESAYLASDLAADHRWPTFGARTLEEVGLSATVSFRLGLDPIEVDESACLNIYARDAEILFGGESLLIGTLLAAHAASAFVASCYQHQVDNLELALRSNREIGMAMGILMGEHRVAADDAFALLRIASQHSNRKLRDIAADVVDTGVLSLPEAPTQR